MLFGKNNYIIKWVQKSKPYVSACIYTSFSFHLQNNAFVREENSMSFICTDGVLQLNYFFITMAREIPAQIIYKIYRPDCSVDTWPAELSSRPKRSSLFRRYEAGWLIASPKPW